MTRSRAHRKPSAGKRPEAADVPRFGVERILQELAAIQARPGGVAAMDRQRVLAELCQALAVEEAVLLERGFDRAYRQIVEGV